jgi:hypothetical protein
MGWTIDAVRKADHSYWDIMTSPNIPRLDLARVDFLRVLADHAMPIWKHYCFYSIIEKGGA